MILRPVAVSRPTYACACCNCVAEDAERISGHVEELLSRLAAVAIARIAKLETYRGSQDSRAF